MITKRILPLGLLLFVVQLSFGQTSINTFQNPVLKGFYPDPSVCRVGEDYYLATSSFEYFPGVPVFQSKDLVNWRQIGHCLTRKSQVDLTQTMTSDGVWAPTLRHHEGTFYMVASKVTRSPWNPINFYVTAINPAGPWSEPVVVEQGAEIGIDPDLFFDDDGKVYYLRNDSRGIVIAEIDILTGKLMSPFRAVWAGTGAPYPEAPHIHKREGYYYLIIAEGGTGPYQRESVARSENIMEGYKAYAHNPILNHTMRANHVIQCTGHADFVQTPEGEWWAFFLGKRSTYFEGFNSVLGREVFMAPVTWTSDDWPIIGSGGFVEEEMKAPNIKSYEWEDTPSRDEFNAPELGLQWNYLRNPVENNYTLSKEKGKLILMGSSLNLSDGMSPTFVGRRQQHFNCEATVQLAFDTHVENEEAGLSIFMDKDHHYEIFLTFRDKKRVIAVRRTIGSLSSVTKYNVIDGYSAELRIVAGTKSYELQYKAGDSFVALDSGETKYLEAPQYTGAYFGMYATGNGEDCKTDAVFDWFEYKEVK
ncbi:MAG: glycoside hydrolase family 43 protein [Catalinimonas sp.]